MLHAIIEPGFFASAPVRLALAIGAAVAIVTALLGVFTVIRGQAFAGEALSDIGTAGGSSAYLIGTGPLPGFAIATTVAATLMELVGIQRTRGRDLATGIVLGAGFAVSALLLYLGTTDDNTTGAVVTILFGSIFGLRPGDLPVTLALGTGAVGLVLVVYRPLLLASASPELAAAKRLPMRTLGFAYLLALAIAVALAELTVGTILSTALLVGPAAAALKLTSRPGRAVLYAAGIGVGTVWLGALLAYDSYDWTAGHTHSWPASFFIVTLVLIVYVAASFIAPRRSG